MRERCGWLIDRFTNERLESFLCLVFWIAQVIVGMSSVFHIVYRRSSYSTMLLQPVESQ